MTVSRKAWLLPTLLLVACSSQVPVNIREAPADNPLLAEVREDTARYEALSVRWGGEILAIENLQDSTLLSVLGRPLSSNGEPVSTDTSEGRFLARIPAFIDPKVYTRGREVTVRGTIAGAESRQVGEYDYAYPVVEATDWYLWPEPAQPRPDYYRWWYYDPWFYHPWYYYPYYHYPHHYRYH